jgi:hypothetical protein
MESFMSSRFTIVEAPPKDPGHCWITKTSVGPFIDTGIDLSVAKIDRGRIYISFDALREMAQTAGLFDESPPVSVELRKREWYEQGYNDAVKEFSGDAVNRFIEHVSRNSVGVAGNAAMVESRSHLASVGAAVSGFEEPTAGTSEGNQDVGGFEFESASVGSVERSSGVSTNSSDDDEYRL